VLSRCDAKHRAGIIYRIMRLRPVLCFRHFSLSAQVPVHLSKSIARNRPAPASSNEAMKASLSGTEPNKVTRDDLESLIEDVQRQIPGAIEGIFGAGSVSWRINRESALFLGAGRAALMQLAHPWVAAALDQHSSVIAKPIARFHNTFRIVFIMIFGSANQAVRASQSLYELHTRIRGQIPTAVAGHAAGSPYEANEIRALRWVFATLIESAVIAYECVQPPLSDSERNAYYSEAKTLAKLFGIRGEALPQDWQSFRGYVAEMCQSQELGVSDRSRTMAHRLLSGSGSWVPIPRWYRALTAEWLPPRFVLEFGLQHGVEQAALASRARRWLPRVYCNLPPTFRFVGPYHEAQARLAHRPPGLLARQSNRFWIGEPQLPFADQS
jgi:uncharacterized protein (DUF2236 family)